MFLTISLVVFCASTWWGPAPAIRRRKFRVESRYEESDGERRGGSVPIFCQDSSPRLELAAVFGEVNAYRSLPVPDSLSDCCALSCLFRKNGLFRKRSVVFVECEHLYLLPFTGFARFARFSTSRHSVTRFDSRANATDCTDSLSSISTDLC